VALGKKYHNHTALDREPRPKNALRRVWNIFLGIGEGVAQVRVGEKG
jgi:hypothetical protein